MNEKVFLISDCSSIIEIQNPKSKIGWRLFAIVFVFACAGAEGGAAARKNFRIGFLGSKHCSR